MEFDLYKIIGVFISVILGLSLMNTVSDYGHSIAVHNNSSDIVKAIAPFVGVIWLAGCFAIAGGLAYSMVKGKK